MDAPTLGQQHAPVRVLPHIKRLDDCFGDFLVRVVYECGACREIQPQALARLVGWQIALKELAPRMQYPDRDFPGRHRGAGEQLAAFEVLPDSRAASR